MPAHRHFMVGDPEAKFEIAPGPLRRRQDEAAFVAIGSGHVLHLGIRHAGRVDDDRRGIAAARPRGKHADKSNVSFPCGRHLDHAIPVASCAFAHRPGRRRAWRIDAGPKMIKRVREPYRDARGSMVATPDQVQQHGRPKPSRRIHEMEGMTAARRLRGRSGPNS